MNEIVRYIFLFLIGTTVINLLIAVAARVKTSYKDYNYLICYWISLFVMYFAEAKMDGSPFAYFFQTVPSFLMVAMLCNSRGIIFRPTYLGIHILGMIVSTILILKTDLGFTLSILPATITICLPFLEPIWNTLVSHKNESSWIEKGLGIMFITAVINHFNYAFFRYDPSSAWWGWSISIAQYQCLSIFLPLMINHQRDIREKKHVEQALDKLGARPNSDEIEDLYKNLEYQITQKEELTKRLQNANSHLEEEREMNEILIKAVSHDLANPLTVINSYLELINSGRIPPEDLKLTLEKIKQNTNSAQEMIKRLRNAVLTRNQSSITDIKPVSIRDTLRIVVEHFESRLKEKEISIKISDTLSSDGKVLADKTTLIEHVFSNVISNAIKFSFRGSKIDVHLKEHKDYVRVEIIDSGIGIEKGRLNKRLSQPFEGTEGELGSGLGLVLMGHFIRKFDGKFEILSDGLEKGTTVRLDLKKSLSQMFDFP